MPDRVRVERIIVRPGRLICDMRITDAAMRYADDALIDRALRDFPSLPHHVCVNDAGETFAAVMRETSVPHLIEHIAIDIQTRASDDPRTTFVGTTEWLDEPAGLARLELGFKDDLEAMRALNGALAFVNGFGCSSDGCRMSQ